MTQHDPFSEEKDIDPRTREGDPVRMLFIILLIFFVLALLLVILRPGILGSILGQH